MGISLNSDINSVMAQMNATNAQNNKADKLMTKLGSDLSTANKDELMEACKSFEAYLVEQVVKQVKDSIVPEREEDDNPYMKMFGDNLYQEYASIISEKGELGIAQKLYEAMKREYNIKE